MRSIHWRQKLITVKKNDHEISGRFSGANLSPNSRNLLRLKQHITENSTRKILPCPSDMKRLMTALFTERESVFHYSRKDGRYEHIRASIALDLPIKIFGLIVGNPVQMPGFDKIGGTHSKNLW